MYVLERSKLVLLIDRPRRITNFKLCQKQKPLSLATELKDPDKT